MTDAEADGQNDGVDGALVPHRYGREAEDGLARQQIDDVEDGEVDEEHVERRSHPRSETWVGFFQFSIPFT